MFSAKLIQKELQGLRQGSNENVREYLRKFNFLAKHADMGNVTLKSVLINSLNERY